MAVVESRRCFPGMQAASQEVAKVNWSDELGNSSHRVLVVVDPAKDLSAIITMEWTLDHVVQRGDNLKLLAILQQNSNPSSKGGFQAGLSKLGYKSGPVEKNWNGVNRPALEFEAASKKQQLLNNLELHLKCQKLGVKLDIDVQLSRDMKVLAVEEAKSFGAHHVILDRSMKKDKKYYIDHLTCYVTRVKTIDVWEPLRPGLHPDMLLNLSSSPSCPKDERPPSAPADFGSNRRSIASSFLTCAEDGDLQSLQGEAEVIEVDDSEHGIGSRYDNLGSMNKSAVAQWLYDQGSPDYGLYPREESLQLSSSPSSEIICPASDSSSADHTSAKVSALSDIGAMSSGEEVTEIAAGKPCASSMSEGSRTGASSVTESTESLISSMRPPTTTIPSPISSFKPATPPSFPALADVGRVEPWSSADISPTGNEAGARQGPISVQPRRVDAWTLHNLNELLKADGREHRSQLEKVNIKTVEAFEQVVRGAPVVKVQRKGSNHAPNPRDLNNVERSSSFRRTVFSRKPAPLAPPLCTICKHKTPEFGKAVRKFSYLELQVATENFSYHNYLAQGGYGSVYRGNLPEGQLVAVKQHKISSSQGDQEFCAEVEALSCAQHRNLVTLIGYCVEDQKRLLVYEYVCNGSLDTHLSAKNKEGLQWKYRQKIAIGAARALRYLHEECRVGCIVHRDMRPNNILLTHDFTPMVGDFGLARRQMDGEMVEVTRVLGTFGYLAPEYAETGQITEKADVYAFGVVLLEIITGRKAIDQQNARGGVLLTDWARGLLDSYDDELVDPRLKASVYDPFEMHCMMHAARQCIKRDPSMRPRMTQVLRILDPAQNDDTPHHLSMGGRKLKPDILPVYTAVPEIQTVADPIGHLSPENNCVSDFPTEIISTPSRSTYKLSLRTGRLKKSGRSMFKACRSSSAPRLSYDEEKNLVDEDDNFKEGVLLSYNSMLEFV